MATTADVFSVGHNGSSLAATESEGETGSGKPGDSTLLRTTGDESGVTTVDEDKADGESEDEMESEGESEKGNSGNSSNCPLPRNNGGESGSCTVSDGRPSVGGTFGEGGTEDEAEDEDKGEDESEDEAKDEGERENGSGNSSLPMKPGDIPGVCNDSDGGPSLPKIRGEAATEAEAEADSKARDESENRSGSSGNSIPQKSGDRPRAMTSALMSAWPRFCDVGERGSLPGEKKAPTDTSGGADWNRRRKLDEERVEQREEGREGGREEGPGGNSIADSSNPLL